jgi:Cd2+/Zn2+-exporting ATPase
MTETKTLRLPVQLPRGFDECERCAGRLTDSLLQLDGVRAVHVDFQHSTMTLTYDPTLSPIDEVEQRAEQVGIEIRERFEHKTIVLVGLDCPDCALKLEKGISRIPGVLWVSTNFASSRMSVEYEPARVDLDTIIRRIRSLGYDARETQVVPLTPSITFSSLGAPSTLTLVSGITLLIACALAASRMPSPAHVLFLISAVAGGFYAARGAYFSLKSLMLDMNFLMTVAAVGAIAIGDYFEAAAVMFLFSLGNMLEARTVEKARESVSSLMGQFPTQARVKREGGEELIPADEVHVGDLFIVRPGEKIATDGTVSDGSTAVNESSITGESTPADKVAGDQVFAGSINLNGSIDVVATTGAADNTLARIVCLVEKAQAEKAPVQRFTEVFGRYYTPAVVVLAVVVALVPPMLFHAAFRSSLYIALTLLVVSCPCALVISTPVSIVSAIGNAARNGILFKGGSFVETAGKVRVIAFDKTGTITTGRADISDVLCGDGMNESDVLSLAATVESRSEHPLAEAIMRAARKREIKPRSITYFQSLTGMGAAAKFDGETCVVGNSRLMDQLGMDTGKWSGELQRLQEEGKTAVLVASGRTIVGIIAVRDTVRETAKSALDQLRKLGVERTVMITGDNELAARSVACDLGIDEYYAELLPQDKVDIIRVLIERFGSVAVVGDGVNDAPALAAATVGIAMGAAGSDTALETADIALMSDDLGKLPYALRLSRGAMGIIHQNLVFSLAVIAVLILTALMGILKLTVGVFGHEGSALLVIANGMRLIRFK